MSTSKLVSVGGDSGVIPKDKLRRGLYATGSYKVDYSTWTEDSFSTKITAINTWKKDTGSAISSVYSMQCYSPTGVLVTTATELHTFTLPTANDLASIPAGWQADKTQAESKFTNGVGLTPENAHFVSNGTKVIYTATNGDIYLTTLATAYDIDSTATSSELIYDHSEYSDFLKSPAYSTFNEDGSKFVILDDDGYWWSWDCASPFVLPSLLSTPFTKDFFGPSTSYSNYRGFLSPDGRRAFCTNFNTDRVRFNFQPFDEGYDFSSNPYLEDQDNYFTSDITNPYFLGFTYDGLQYFAGNQTNMRAYSVVEPYKAISAWYPEIDLGDFDATGDFVWILDRGSSDQGQYFYARKNGVGFEGFFTNGYTGQTNEYDMLVVGASGNRLRINKTKFTSLSWTTGSRVDWVAFAASPGFMDIQFRTGTAANSTNFHALGYAPDLIWCPSITSSNTYQYIRNLNPGAGGDAHSWSQIFSQVQSYNSTYFWSEATKDAYYVGTSTNVNTNNRKYCDILFTFSAPYFGENGNEAIAEILTWAGDGTGSKIVATPSSGAPPRLAFFGEGNATSRAYGGLYRMLGASWCFYSVGYTFSNNYQWNLQGLYQTSEGFNWGNGTSSATVGGLWDNGNAYNDVNHVLSLIMLPEPPKADDEKYVTRLETQTSRTNSSNPYYARASDGITGSDPLTRQHNNQNVAFRIIREKGTPTNGSYYHSNTMANLFTRCDSQANGTTISVSEYNFRTATVQYFVDQVDNSYIWEFKAIPDAIETVSYRGDGTGNRNIPQPLGNGPEAILLTDVQTANLPSTDMRMYWYYGSFQNGHATGQAFAQGGSVETSTSPDMKVDFSTGYMRSYSSTTTNYNAIVYAGVIFKTKAGVLKVGGYTGNGSTQNIACGFSGDLPSALLIRDAEGNNSTTQNSSHYLFTSDGIKNSGVAGYGEALFTTPGTHSWTCPSGVTSVSVVCVGGGGGGAGVAGYGGGGGALMYRNNVSVTPGTTYTVRVGEGGVGENWSASPIAAPGGDSYFDSSTNRAGGGGSGMDTTGNRGAGGIRTGGDGGGNGGDSGFGGRTNGGGGAGGYSGDGGDGGDASTPNVFVTGGDGAGGGGGAGGSQPMSGYYSNNAHAGGGGVGLYGEGDSGVGGLGGSASTAAQGGKGGSGGGDGTPLVVATTLYNSNNGTSSNGGLYGGGGGGSGNSGSDGWAGQPGAVRIVWPGNTRSFPSTNVVQDDSDQGFPINTTTDGPVTGDCIGAYSGGFQIKEEPSFALNTSGRRYVFIAWA